jgi:hypothetical protein
MPRSLAAENRIFYSLKPNLSPSDVLPTKGGLSVAPLKRYPVVTEKQVKLLELGK